MRFKGGVICVAHDRREIEVSTSFLKKCLFRSLSQWITEIQFVGTESEVIRSNLIQLDFPVLSWLNPEAQKQTPKKWWRKYAVL